MCVILSKLAIFSHPTVTRSRCWVFSPVLTHECRETGILAPIPPFSPSAAHLPVALSTALLSGQLVRFSAPAPHPDFLRCPPTVLVSQPCPKTGRSVPPFVTGSVLAIPSLRAGHSTIPTGCGSFLCALHLSTSGRYTWSSAFVTLMAVMGLNQNPKKWGSPNPEGYVGSKDMEAPPPLNMQEVLGL